MGNAFLLDGRRPFSFSGKKMGVASRGTCAALTFAPVRKRKNSLSRKRISPFDPQEKGIRIVSEQLEELQCLPIALPIARRSRVGLCYTTWLAPTIRCRSACLVVVQTNFRLLQVSSMRRASAMPHSVGSLSPDKRHSRLTIVRRGCDRSQLAGIHGEAMYTAPDSASIAALQATDRQ